MARINIQLRYGDGSGAGSLVCICRARKIEMAECTSQPQGGGPAFADVVSVLAYDALGRLVGRQAPYPGTTDEWRTETYFYDGARRIAERWRDPIIGNHGGGQSGNQQNQQTQYVQWTEREYVYTPGYIDEFVAEYDAVVRQRVLSPS